MKTIQEMCLEYGCDKTPEIRHSYAPIYDNIFKDLKNVQTILEIGVGFPALMQDYINAHSLGMGRSYVYRAGVSLYIWKEYFPEAMVYGIDINPDAQVVGEDRIKTFLGDSTNKDFITKIATDVGPFDIIIDDGSHNADDQLKTAQFLLPYVKSGGLYFIEDTADTRGLIRALTDRKVERLSTKRGDKLNLIRC